MEDARKLGGERNWRNGARNRDSWQKLLKKALVQKGAVVPMMMIIRRYTVYIQQLIGAVAGLRWNFHLNSANRQSDAKHSTYRLLFIYSIPPDDGLQICPKHVQVD